MRDDDIGGPIRWRLHLPASPEAVYEMLDSDSGRASFWATSASDADWIETHAGWLNVLLPLKAQVAFGVDLRNHDPQRSWEAGYVDP